jgi:hypothetical protein
MSRGTNPVCAAVNLTASRKRAGSSSWTVDISDHLVEVSSVDARVAVVLLISRLVPICSHTNSGLAPASNVEIYVWRQL